MVALSEGVKEVLILRQVQHFMEPSRRILHGSRKTKHIGVRHDLVIDACEAGKFRVVYARTEYQHADMFTKPLYITYRRFTSMRKQSSIKCNTIRVLVDTMSAAKCFVGNIGSCEA